MKNSTVRTLGTWFGLGDIKKAPGTFGTLGAIPLFVILNFIRRFFQNDKVYNSFYFIFLMTFFILSVYISDICEKDIFKKKDPQEVVIDEVLGFLTTMFLINPVGLKENIIAITLGFIIFRILDITKVGPINHAQELGNGVGVVLDDFLAGMIGNFILVTFWSIILFYLK